MASNFEQIGKVLEFLGDNFREQPTLEDLAMQAKISPFHLQRLFKEWVGISPKRFLQYLTVDYAKGLLEDSRSVLDTAFDSGLSGPGRLHDLFVTLEAVTPGEFKNGGAGLEIKYGIHDSPFGTCLLATTERGICWLSLHDTDVSQGIAELQARWIWANISEDPGSTGPLSETIFQQNRSGDGPSKITLLVKGSNFQIKVWQALLQIPSGYMASYNDIARYIGQPSASRAVGNAVGANPVSFIIPCHRVIKKMGIIGKYHWGTGRKKGILGWEAANRFEMDSADRKTA